MSETAAITTVPATPPGPAPRPAAMRVLSDEVDLYAEGNSFSEADWAGPRITDLFGKDGLNFKDLVDIINPLQHLPVVGTVYRAVTGDELAPAPRVIGGTLFGGIAGFVSSLANAVLENETGQDAGDTVLALFTGDTAAPATVAAATAPSPVSAPETAQAVAAHKPTKVSTPPGTHSSTAGGAPGGIDLRDVLHPNAAETGDNPTAALIQAHAAVPKSARSATSSLALPGGKSLPIHFRSGRSTVASPQATQAVPSPQTAAKAAKPTETAAATTAKPRSLQPTAPLPAPAAAPPRDTLAAATPAETGDREIASKMLDALEKYETLMRSRTAPSISGEI